MIRLGIDLGGTKIEGIALGPDGKALIRQRMASPRHDYQTSVQAICTLVRDIETHPSIVGEETTLGIGIPGAISKATGLIKNANSTWLNGKPLLQDLETALKRPINLANDANCFAVSEATDGAARGMAVVFGVILGTGVGGGIALSGKPWVGPNAIAGEWGHNPLPWPTDDERPGPPCYCGKAGCIETFLSGPGLLLNHNASSNQPKLASAQQVIEKFAENDRAAKASIDLYLDRLARALAGVINILDPDAIVLGGGLSNADCIYDDLPARLKPYVFSDQVTTQILKNRHGDSSGVRGAAWLWPLN